MTPAFSTALIIQQKTSRAEVAAERRANSARDEKALSM